MPGQRQRVGGVEALPPVDAVPVWGIQDGQWDAHPDLRWLCQGPRTPLVPWLPAQAAGGARIRRHQKQAPVDTVTVHTCETREEQKSLLSWGT